MNFKKSEEENRFRITIGKEKKPTYQPASTFRGLNSVLLSKKRS